MLWNTQIHIIKNLYFKYNHIIITIFFQVPDPPFPVRRIQDSSSKPLSSMTSAPWQQQVSRICKVQFVFQISLEEERTGLFLTGHGLWMIFLTCSDDNKPFHLPVVYTCHLFPSGAQESIPQAYVAWQNRFLGINFGLFKMYKFGLLKNTRSYEKSHKRFHAGSQKLLWLAWYYVVIKTCLIFCNKYFWAWIFFLQIWATYFLCAMTIYAF
jgi:hypothetical protein